METHFMEYLIPALYEKTPASPLNFFEERLKQICREEGFVSSLKQIPGMAPTICLEVKSTTATKVFGMRYHIGYAVIAGKPQILSRQYLSNGKPMPKAPGRFKERLEILDAKIRRLFPDEPIFFNAPA